MPKSAWKAISLLSGGIGVVALLGLVIAGVSTARTGTGYGELMIWVAATVVLLPLAYISNRLGRST